MRNLMKFHIESQGSKTLLIRFIGIALILLGISACSTATSERTSMIGIKSAKRIAVEMFRGPEKLREETTTRFTRELGDLDKFEIYDAARIQEFMDLNQLDPDVIASAHTREVLRESLGIDGVFTGDFITYQNKNPKRTADNMELTVRLISTDTGLVSYSAVARSDDAGRLTGNQSEVIQAVVDMILNDISKKF
jgi:hypothetical protein